MRPPGRPARLADHRLTERHTVAVGFAVVLPVVLPVGSAPVSYPLGAPTDLCPCVPAGCYVTVPESARPREMEGSNDVYAIVRAGGRQEKVAVGDVLLIDQVDTCLLYTSDAAAARTSVDLGGRRTLKKKKKIKEN